VKAIGTLSHETRSGNLVIKGNELTENRVPRIYSYACTKKGRLGKIRDVIGPKSRPYIVLKPEKKLNESELSKLAGTTIYESRSKHAKTRRNSTRQKSRVH
jgi:rRNA processing protein Gar1